MTFILFTDVLELTETDIPNGHTTEEVILDPFHIEAPYV